MNSRKISELWSLALKALGMIATIALLSAGASAQEATWVDTEINGVAESDFPLTITHNYELGRQDYTYATNGIYGHPCTPGFGPFKSITVADVTIPVGGGPVQVTFGGCTPTIEVVYEGGRIRIIFR